MQIVFGARFAVIAMNSWCPSTAEIASTASGEHFIKGVRQQHLRDTPERNSILIRDGNCICGARRGRHLTQAKRHAMAVKVQGTLAVAHAAGGIPAVGPVTATIVHPWESMLHDRNTTACQSSLDLPFAATTRFQAYV